jgi:hypothetical protein
MSGIFGQGTVPPQEGLERLSGGGGPLVPHDRIRRGQLPVAQLSARTGRAQPGRDAKDARLLRLVVAVVQFEQNKVPPGPRVN